MSEKGYCVYEHVFPNGKRYIGITCDPKKRWRNGKGYEKQGKIANAINSYGWENISHNIIIDGITQEQAGSLEQYLIAALDTVDNGYNTAIGGENIISSYLNEHVLLMIRESKKQDEIWGHVQPSDGIVTLAEMAKKNKKLADKINHLDEIVESKHPECKTYHGNMFFSGENLRCDSYWWYMREHLMVASGLKSHVDDYWETLQREIWCSRDKTQEEVTANG